MMSARAAARRGVAGSATRLIARLGHRQGRGAGQQSGGHCSLDSRLHRFSPVLIPVSNPCLVAIMGFAHVGFPHVRDPRRILGNPLARPVVPILCNRSEPKSGNFGDCVDLMQILRHAMFARRRIRSASPIQLYRDEVPVPATAYHASIGPALTLYDIDVDVAALTKRSTVTLP